MPRIFKKRKGFHSVRKWQLEVSSGSNVSQEPLPSTSSGTSTQVGPRPMRNMSAEKLSNSDFKKMDKQEVRVKNLA